MYKDIFKEIGLNPNEAIVYEYLIKHGTSTAGVIIKEAPLKRGVAYNALASLVEKKLITETQSKANKASTFSPDHPTKLREYIDEKERELLKSKNSLESNLPEITSIFNLVSGQPGVRIYEGLDGIKKTINDSLTSKTEILTIADIEAIEKYIKKIEAKYVEERNRLGISKRLIVLDSPRARKMENFPKHFTADTKYCQFKIDPFNTGMQIYDNKVSFITLTDKLLMGIIIENEYIYSTQKALFEFIWNKL